MAAGIGNTPQPANANWNTLLKQMGSKPLGASRVSFDPRAVAGRKDGEALPMNDNAIVDTGIKSLDKTAETVNSLSRFGTTAARQTFHDTRKGALYGALCCFVISAFWARGMVLLAPFQLAWDGIWRMLGYEVKQTVKDRLPLASLTWMGVLTGVGATVGGFYGLRESMRNRMTDLKDLTFGRKNKESGKEPDKAPDKAKVSKFTA